MTIPAIVDADTGFGGAENVARTICELEKAGLAGCHIEDQEFPKRCGHLAGKSVVDVDEMTGRIKAAVRARRDEDFMIIARTDARAVEDFDSAVERCPELCRSRRGRDFSGSFAKRGRIQGVRPRSESAVPREHDGVRQESPALSFTSYADFGYRMVIFPMSAFRVSMKASEEFLRDLKKRGTQSGWLDKMQTRKELYELLDYDPTAENWKADVKSLTR